MPNWQGENSWYRTRPTSNGVETPSRRNTRASGSPRYRVGKRVPGGTSWTCGTGAQIKTAAIEQGVDIRVNFVFVEELPMARVGSLKTMTRFTYAKSALHRARKRPCHLQSRSIEQPVKLKGHKATGGEIKAAAIAQGVLSSPTSFCRRNCQMEPAALSETTTRFTCANICASPQSRRTTIRKRSAL